MSQRVWAGAIGGDISLTSDYIFRGVSQSNGRAAAQLDVHASTAGGTFIGAFGSTLETIGHLNSEYEIEPYIGHRFDLSPSWSVTLTAVQYSYHHRHQAFSNDYQEIGAAVAYLDRWTVSVAAAPNAVLYAGPYRLGRYPAYVADASGQLPLIGRLFATAGIGYYSVTGPEGIAYVYGNAGLAFEYRAWRVDAGYYVTADRAQRLYPPGWTDDRFAATLSWHF
jgi:uncharacterized protein (TIGR02001 family)